MSYSYNECLKGGVPKWNVDVSDDRAAVEQLLTVSKPGAVHVVRHYMYFRAKRPAADVAAALRSRAFETELRLSADGSNWLVLARQETVVNEQTIAAARELLEDFARGGNGEYDGWEAEAQK